MGFSSADLFTLDQVCADNSFAVPEFQRGYAWGEEQWKALWDDAVHLSNRGLMQHYGGSIMISEREDGKETVDLIDGQQRMTTLSLMLAALGGTGFPIKFRDNEGMQAHFDFYALRQEHLLPSLKRHKSYYARNLENASAFFSARAAELSSDERDALAHVLRTRFKLFVLVIQPDFNVHVAFETINNRGRPLSTLEKLKNRLIYLASSAPDIEDGRNAIAEVHRCWKQVYAWLGASSTLLDDDEFLRAHSIGWFRHERKAEWLTLQLFDDEFSAHKDVEPEYIRRYVRSLEVAAACWHLINEPGSLHSAVHKQLAALQRSAHAVTKPLLLWALMRLATEHKQLIKSPDADFGWAGAYSELVIQAERFGVLVVLGNDRTSSVGQSDVNRGAFSLAHPGVPLYPNYPDLSSPDDSIEAVEFASDHLASLIYNVVSTPLVGGETEYLDHRFPWEGFFDPEKMKTVIADRLRKRQGFYTWQFGKLLIYLWEARLRGEKGRPEKKPWEKFAWDDSVEHIYPQRPEKGWQEAISLDGRSAILARTSITNSLGNLLLLSRSINSSVSNDVYPSPKGRGGKRVRFENGSYSEMQVARLCDQWTVLQIAARGIAMFRHAQEHWGFEVVSADQKITEWLPFLFGDLAPSVLQGNYSNGRAITARALTNWVEKFEVPL